MCSKQGLTRWYPFLSDNAASSVKIGRKALDPPGELGEEGGIQPRARAVNHLIGMRDISPLPSHPGQGLGKHRENTTTHGSNTPKNTG